MFYNANLYKVGLMNSQRHGGQRSTSMTFLTPEIPGADVSGRTVLDIRRPISIYQFLK